MVSYGFSGHAFSPQDQYLHLTSATRSIPAGTLIDISPVILFGKEEYHNYGRFTVVDHYTFVWRDGRMALALGLG